MITVKNKICEYIDSQKDLFLSDLKALVDIKSVREAATEDMPFGKGPAAALGKAEEICASHGFQMTNLENYAGEITYGKDPSLMLLAHLDVVEEGDFWTYEPYNMIIENGRAYGRGTTDDKGAALCRLYAMKAVRELFGEETIAFGLSNDEIGYIVPDNDFTMGDPGGHYHELVSLGQYAGSSVIKGFMELKKEL